MTVIVANSRVVIDEAVSVSVEEPVSALSVTGLLLHDAVTPLGSPLTLRLAAPVYVALPANVIESVTVFPCTTVKELEAAPIVMDGAGATCNVICLLADNPSPLAVTVTAAEPAAAADEAVSERVEEPLSPLSVTGLLLHDAVTPLGSPLTAKLTAPLNVALLVNEITSVAVFPWTTVGEAEAAVIARDGAGATCTAICLLAVNPSPLPVTVIVADAWGALDDAVSESVEEPLSPLSVTGLLLHEAVTPLGSPLTLRLTAPLNVALPASEIASVTVFPCTTVSGARSRSHRDRWRRRNLHRDLLARRDPISRGGYGNRCRTDRSHGGCRQSERGRTALAAEGDRIAAPRSRYSTRQSAHRQAHRSAVGAVTSQCNRVRHRLSLHNRQSHGSSRHGERRRSQRNRHGHIDAR